MHVCVCSSNLYQGKDVDTLLFGFNVFSMADVFGTHTSTHMRSSWQHLDGANNRLDALA